MYAELGNGYENGNLKIKGVTKVVVEKGFLNVYRDDQMLGNYSLDSFTEDSPLKYVFEEVK